MVELLHAEPRHFASLKSGAFRESLTLAPGGVATPEVVDMLAGLAENVGRLVQPSAWLILEDREVVGLCSILRFSPAGEAEIGYGIAPSRQGRGAARGAVAAVIAWAKMNPLIKRVVAETGVDNGPSQRVLERNGFSRVGERDDEEDGRLFRWALDVGNVASE